MTRVKISDKELRKLEELAQESKKNFLAFPFIYILPIALFALIPSKYIPYRLSPPPSHINHDESLMNMVGTKNFLLFLLAWTILFVFLALKDYKNIAIKKDLKDKNKLLLKGEVESLQLYKGEHYARVKNQGKIDILKFDYSNFVQLNRRDIVEYEVYEHSRNLIKIVSQEKKKEEFIPRTIIEVTDKCPACLHELSADQIECPECGLNFA
ncbi:MAG: hypothetical protein P1U56_22495 [Saprospiraceae bacterium]|nr:hypothetical protein [Saprospiraceae bacterium]